MIDFQGAAGAYRIQRPGMMFVERSGERSSKVNLLPIESRGGDVLAFYFARISLKVNVRTLNLTCAKGRVC